MKTKPQFNFFPKFTFLLLFLLTLNVGFGQTATAPSGAGTSANPYQIATLENLYWIIEPGTDFSTQTHRLRAHYLQIADIDASATSNLNYNSGEGWPGIGDDDTSSSYWYSFEGVYDGGNFEILNLHIQWDRENSHLNAGLFNLVANGGVVKNIKLIDFNYDLATSGNTANAMFGGVIGIARDNNTLIENVHAINGQISVQVDGQTNGGGWTIGGIIGQLGGSTSDAPELKTSSTINVEIISEPKPSAGLVRIKVGGLVGTHRGNALIENCFSRALLSAEVPFSSASNNNGIGGITAQVLNTARIRKVYDASSQISILPNSHPDTYTAAIVAGYRNTDNTNPVFEDVFFNQDFGNPCIDYNGNTSTLSCNGESTANMKLQSTFTGYDFNNVWTINPLINDGYPFLQSSNLPVPNPCDDFAAEAPTLDNGVYQISTFNHLRWISENSSSWGADFIQTADIDAVITSNNCYNSGEGWLPIGNSTTKFSGSYDGDGHTISNLFINRPNEQRIALFGETNGATIQNLGLIDPDITVTGTGQFGMGSNVGSLVGFAGATDIAQCFAAGGSVTAGGAGVGGLIGQLSSSSNLSNSYAIVAVEGGDADQSNYSAGLVGVNSSSTITNCYAAGSVALKQFGGFLTISRGLSQNNGGTITNSFYDSDATGQSTGGGTAKTTLEMQQQATFTNWDFQCEAENGTANFWGIDEGNDYPRLSWEGFIQTCPCNISGLAPIVGDGLTASTAYEIASFENLLWITEDPSRWDKFYVQTANIDAGVTKTSEICFGTEGWSPIGNSTTKFTGNYNGGNFEIQNLYINRTDSDYQGLFGWGLNCNINNLSLTGVDITARYFSGGLLGRLGDNNNSTIAQITNINVSGTINGNNNVTVDTRAGGLIGLSQNAVIDSCTSSVIVSASSRSGGLIGENTTFTPGTGGIIKNCTSSGSVSSNGLNIGGLVGYTNIDTKIQNSSSSSNVSALAGAGGLIGYANKSLISNSFAVGNITISESNTGFSDAGGLIGYALDFSLIDSCYATGSINGTGRNIGGLIGDFSGSSIVRNSYATGDVVSTGTQGQIGGFIGLYRGAEMSNCYAKGNVTRGGSSSNPGAGGLIGTNGGGANASPIVNCYSTGFVSGAGSGSFGGLVGITTNAQSITNSFWDTTTSGQSTSDGGTAKTTLEMQQQATFTNWDFQCEAANGIANFWGIDEGNDYPRLSWEGFTQDCTVQWTGAVSSDWNTAGNWSNQEGPNTFSIPVITNVANQPTAANNIEVAALQINSGSSLTMQALTSLKVNGNITNNGQILFKSDASGSGQFDAFAGTISGSGNVVIERYIPARRAFRFLSSAITSSGSINANWQEGAVDATDNPNPGFGTHITGSTTGENGFDATPSGNPSLFTFDNATQSWEAVTNTDVNAITAGTPYRILVRGDRSIDVTSNSAVPTTTTIRSTGATTTLNTGTISINGLSQVASEYNFIGNPYPAAVDMNQVLSAATNMNQVTYWVWDPTLGGTPTPGQPGGRGAYVAVNVNDNTSNNGSSNANRYLQPGQAAFVQTAANGATTMSFEEGYKAVSQPQTQVFNVASTIRMKLYDAFSFANAGTSSDGLLLKFSEEGSNQLTFEDAMKFYNQDENLASVNGETLLSIESRAWPEVGETIPLFNNQYRKTSYVFEIELHEMNALEVLLKDHFTGTTAELQNNTHTLYAFEVDATIPASIANDRFEIVFEEETLSSDTPLFGEDFILYPNPTSSTFYIATRDIPGDEVKLTVRSISGQKVFTKTMTVPSNGQLQVELPELSSGMYLVELTHPKGGIFTSKLIKK